MQVQCILGSTAQSAVQIGPLPANSWQQVTLSMSALGVANQANFTGFWLQAEGGSTVPTFYVDDISLVTNAVTAGTNAPVSITVDAQANRHAISPMIYGVAFATSNSAGRFEFHHEPVRRKRRDPIQLADSMPRATRRIGILKAIRMPPAPSRRHGGCVCGRQIKSGGAQPMITIPMIGWLPKLGPVAPSWSYSTTKYGPQTSTDPYWPDAGNGMLRPTDTPITTNNPTDANFPTNANFQHGCVQHLMNQWGTSTNGGVRYYIMDNEQSLWFSTHQDVHPVGPTMQEIRTDFFNYASMVKSNDPNALVGGPEEWGWPGYLYSGYDQQWSGAHNDYNPADYPDRGQRRMGLHAVAVEPGSTARPGTGQRVAGLFHPSLLSAGRQRERRCG